MDKPRKRRRKFTRLVWDCELEALLARVISWQKAEKLAALICEKYDVLDAK